MTNVTAPVEAPAYVPGPNELVIVRLENGLVKAVFDPDRPHQVSLITQWGTWVARQITGMRFERVEVDADTLVAMFTPHRLHVSEAVTPDVLAQIRALMNARYYTTADVHAMIDRSDRRHVGTTVTFTLARNGWVPNLTTEEITRRVLGASAAAILDDPRRIVITMMHPTLEEERIRDFANAAGIALRIQAANPDFTVRDDDREARLHRAYDYRPPSEETPA